MISKDGYELSDRTISMTPIDDVTKVIEVSAGTEITVFSESVSDDPSPRSALFALRFLDEDGVELEIPGWKSSSEKAGTYQYLVNADEIGVTTFGVEAPARSAMFVIQGVKWRSNVNTWILEDVIVVRQGIDPYPVQLPSGSTLPIHIRDFSQSLEIADSMKSVTISGQASLPSSKSTALLTVAFVDREGRKMLPPGHLPQNPVHGPFFQIKGDAGVVEFEFNVVPRPNVSSIEIKGVEWGDPEVTINGPLDVTPITSDFVDIDGFLSDIPEGEPLIVIDTTAPPMGDDTRALRPNNLAKAFARLGAWVIFLPFSSIQEFEPRFSDHILQVPRSEYGRLVETLIKRGMPNESTFISSSFPSLASVTLATRLKTEGWQVIYEARDDMEEFNRVGYSKWYAPSLERQMLTIADKVVSVSIGLDEKLVSMWPKLSDHVVVPNAVNRSVIDASADLRTQDQFDQRANSLVVGYVGHLTPAWFDWPAVLSAARMLPHVQFEIIGHGAPANLDLPSNVVILGPKTHEELASIVPTWKVGLIPFLDIPLTRSVDPNKIYEYFAWGLRCVTAPMGSVEEYPSTYVYRGAEQLVLQLQAALTEPYTAEEIKALEVMVQNSDWDSRARQCLDYYGIVVKESLNA
ncbi:hypothetical protein HD598_000875 [Neomicrococcus aestuarii]|uniref:Uncharacterized protein n=1 Tax=Neomicrococcus aestuarii TaxID=556325 RepID=A0A7W8TUC8_9MICC|nr:hypothetical protein [Neomicrococcus aestuarii]MBB5512188.1 hypothetical protein [Neomicrococcus aestuarii]